MPDRLDGCRVLIYSHDTFGLGHLRRCRTIAHSLVEHFKGLTVLILSGSPIIGSFEFRARVDFVRIPGVIKLHNGEYTPLSLHVDIEQTLEMREAIIRHTAQTFRPQLLLVDKEPLGLRGEMEPTLRMLAERDTMTVLGLRDFMDEPTLLRREWERKNVLPALERLYDEIWVYGPELMGDPLAGLEVPAGVRARMYHTGYLRRSVPQASAADTGVRVDGPYVLVTAGGGGDGAQLMDWVLRAYEDGRDLPHQAVLVLGPFMQAALRNDFTRRAQNLPDVHVTTFDRNLEVLMQGAVGVVAMGGYNTFCEILSFDKPAILLPRSAPRREQLMRAHRAAELGLVRVLDAGDTGDPEIMQRALRALPEQPRPGQVRIEGLLDGIDNVNRRVEAAMLARRGTAALAVGR